MGTGILWSAVAVLDPIRPAGSLAGPLLAALALLVAPREGRVRPPLVLAAILICCFAVAARAGPVFRADSAAYYVYLRSAAFDRDLDFANEWRTWGYAEGPRTPTGLTRNTNSVGPALLWSPFYAVAHGYVLLDRAIATGAYAANGYSPPYRRAPALGTLTAVLLGAWLLTRMLSRHFGPAVAVLAVTGAVLATPILYYAFVVPTMSHGLAFAASAALVWAWDRAQRSPSLGAWIVLGACFGVMTLVRWQALVLAALLVPLALSGLLQRKARLGWLVAGGLIALLMFVPQLIAWKVLYGAWITIPLGGGYVDWTSPRWLDTLVSANHGLFSWTPVALIGVVGLVGGLVSAPLLHSGALLSFVAIAWVNGGVSDWAGADAFGARRYDVVVPFLALGLAHAITWTADAVRRRPLLVPALVLAFLSLWNVGFISLFRAGGYPEAAPVERLAKDQALVLRRVVQDTLGRLFGPRGSALAYSFFSGEYFYVGHFNPSGTIDLAQTSESELSGGWSAPRRPREGPSFRWAVFPEACARIPLLQPFDFEAIVTIRAPRRVQPQHMTVLMNGHELAEVVVGPEWAEIPFAVAAEHQQPGENYLCLRFSRKAVGGRGVSAAVSRIQLP
jgi:hypothetical protein